MFEFHHLGAAKTPQPNLIRPRSLPTRTPLAVCLGAISATLAAAYQSPDVQDAVDYTTGSIYGQSCSYTLSVDRWYTDIVGDPTTGEGLSELQLSVLALLPTDLTLQQDLGVFRGLSGAVASHSGQDPGAEWTHERQSRSVYEHNGQWLIQEGSGGTSTEQTYFIRTIGDDTIVGGGTSTMLRVFGRDEPVFLGALGREVLAPFPRQSTAGESWLTALNGPVQEGVMQGAAAVRLSHEIREGGFLFDSRAYSFQRIAGHMLPRASHQHGVEGTSISTYFYSMVEMASAGLVPFPSEIVTVSFADQVLHVRRMRLEFIGETASIESLRIPVLPTTKIRWQPGALSPEEMRMAQNEDPAQWPERIRDAILFQ